MGINPIASFEKQLSEFAVETLYVNTTNKSNSHSLYDLLNSYTSIINHFQLTKYIVNLE